LKLPKNPDGDPDGDGYTNLEEYASLRPIPPFEMTIPPFHFIAFAASLFLFLSVRAADPLPGLVIDEQPGQITISYAGTDPEPGRPGIPSWKAILLQNDGGNISALHVPANSPLDVSSRRGGWPITVLATRSMAGVNLPDKGRDNYARFSVQTMEVTSRSPEEVIVAVAGPSPQKHYNHERTYTFTPRGVAIEGSLVALVDLKRVSWDPHWDRDQIADSHVAAVPLRTQGRHGWIPAFSSGSDAVTPLPDGVDFPLEAEVKLRRDTPTFIRIFIDKNFDTSGGRRTMVNNNKDFEALPSHRMYYEKLIGGLAGGPLMKGKRDSFKVRYEFETR
jgi:hypothetical protein